jgi:hypothetical protein
VLWAFHIPFTRLLCFGGKNEACRIVSASYFLLVLPVLIILSCAKWVIVRRIPDINSLDEFLHGKTEGGICRHLDFGYFSEKSGKVMLFPSGYVIQFFNKSKNGNKEESA